jgi:hypothetical protein
MSRLILPGILGAKSKADVLTAEYLNRVYSEPYGIIGAGILNWDEDGNPPADLFLADGTPNPVNYNSNAARDYIKAKLELYINTFGVNYNNFLWLSIDYLQGFKCNTQNKVIKLFNINNQIGDPIPIEGFSPIDITYNGFFVENTSWGGLILNRSNNNILEAKATIEPKLNNESHLFNLGTVVSGAESGGFSDGYFTDGRFRLWVPRIPTGNIVTINNFFINNEESFSLLIRVTYNVDPTPYYIEKNGVIQRDTTISNLANYPINQNLRLFSRTTGELNFKGFLKNLEIYTL